MMALSEIVVGIDFGTTHSGVSWAVKLTGAAPHIRVINDWPNPRSRNPTSDKVPTSISYTPNGQPSHWGYYTAPSQNTFKWFKILLEPNSKYGQEASQVQQASRLLQEIDRTAEDVAGDYLRFVWQYTKADIARYQGDDWQDIYSVRCVLTVPAIWSAVAKERTLAAAKAAGLPENIVLVSEPEAAALTVLQDRASEESLKEGESFVVCDAGGGTVDLISYKIKSLNPFQIEESAIGDGGLCGSIFLDMAFEKYIIKIVGENQYKRLKPKSRARMMEDFEYNVKRSFSGEAGQYSVDLKGVEDDPSHHIDDDTITLQPTMLRTIFDYVCSDIQNLVKTQIDGVSEKGSAVKAILLVGGFGGSKYLHDYLAVCQKQAGIKVLQSPNAWSAICRGATSWGIESANAEPTVTSRLSRCSYGTPCQQLFDPNVHLEKDRIMDPLDGQFKADNQINWFLKRGQEIKDGAEIKRPFFRNVEVHFYSTGSATFSEELHICEDEVPPTRREPSVKEFCKVGYAIPLSEIYQEKRMKSPSAGVKYRQVWTELALVMGSAKLDFRAYHQGKVVAYCEAKYVEDM